MSFQIRWYRKLPTGLKRYPLDVTFSVFGIPASILSLIGLSEPSSIAELLPTGVNKAWSAVLLVGCISWLIGIMSAEEIKPSGVVILHRIPVTVFGLWLVSSASFVYGCALLIVAGWVGLTAATSMFVFCVGTTLRRINLMDRDTGSG